MDRTLLINYVHAVRIRPILQLLPEGIREYALGYERLALNDICTQTGKDLTETEALALAPSTTSKIIQALLPVVKEMVITLIKKYFPAIATSGAVSAALTYLVTK